MDVISEAWDQHVSGNPWYVLTIKMKKAKSALIKLNQNLDRLGYEVLLVKNDLLQFQSSLSTPHSEEEFFY